MRHRRLAILYAAVFTTIMASADERAEREAVEAADTWLALVDGGEYERSWNDAAAFFRNAVTAEQWSQQLRAVRAPLGSLVSRKVKSKQYAEALPGAPDGQYVVIQYETSFQNKKSATETVTPMMDADGTWRVSGYFIK